MPTANPVLNSDPSRSSFDLTGTPPAHRPTQARDAQPPIANIVVANSRPATSVIQPSTMPTGAWAEAVAALDPLDADRACALVPALNQHADVNALIDSLRSLIPTRARLERLSVPQSLAAVRDLGLFLGSLKRHGVEPVSVVPEVQAVLETLGQRTAMVPRDTVYHYGPWNPADGRQRMYLGSRQEAVLIGAVRRALPAVEAATLLLVELLDRSPADPAFATACRQTAAHLEAMVCAINDVRTEITADYFARSMRPYFESVIVTGRPYFGPAAAHMPLFLVDALLWSADHPDAEHHAFQDDTALYNPLRWRRLFNDLSGRPSISTRVVEGVAAAHGEPNRALRESIEALCQVYRVLLVFRGRHAVLARAAYDVERRLYSRGSGGGTVASLEHLVTLTRDYGRALKPRPTDERPGGGACHHQAQATHQP
jgi:monodechloroaminopyrrolnitrin synthase